MNDHNASHNGPGAASVPGWVTGYDRQVVAPRPDRQPLPVAQQQPWVGSGDVVRSDQGLGGDEAGPVVATVRAEIADELAERVAAAESRAGAVLDGPARRAIADELITAALERWAHTRLTEGRSLLSPAVEVRVRRAVLDGLFGLGGLQPLLDDLSVENININGADRVFVRYADGRRARVGAVAGSDAELIELIRLLGARSESGQERRFDPGAPMLNLQLPDGSRLFAVMAVCRRPSVSIRRHRYRRVTLDQLVGLGTIGPVLAAFLGAAVRARLNILVAGGPNIGKTTFLIGLASEIPPQERLVTIEDSFELGLDRDTERHPDVVALQERDPNTEGEGAISQTELVRAALRQSPDRVIVGEIRGAEVVPVFNVMSQGIDGSMATIHASSTRKVFPKMAAYAAQGPERLTMEATALLVASAVHLVVHLAWSTDKVRVVTSVREVIDAEGQQVISNEIFAPGPDGRARPAAPLRTDTLTQLVAAGLNPDLLNPSTWTPT